MEFTEQIKEWVAIDNKVRLLNEEVKAMRSMRTDMTANIMNLAEEKNLGNPIIEITDGKLKFNNFKITSPLTFKLLKRCLQDCIGNNEHVEKIMTYIKENREYRYIKDIKRTYTKNT
jgi:hypothetical protein